METIFWNVDTQYDFMRNDESHKGTLHVPGARAIESNLERLTLYAETQDITVVNTADWHTLDSKEFSDTPDYMNTFSRHCLENTIGAQYVPVTAPANPYKIDWRDESVDGEKILTHRELVLYKDAFGAFEGTPHAETVLNILSPKKAVVYGVATNVCVDFAVMGLLARGVEVYVPTDAIKELPGPVDHIYKKWVDAGAKLTTVEDVVGGRI